MSWSLPAVLLQLSASRKRGGRRYERAKIIMLGAKPKLINPENINDIVLALHKLTFY